MKAWGQLPIPKEKAGMVAQIYNPSPVRGGWGWGGRGWGAGQTGGFVTAGWPPAWLHGQQQTLSQGTKERLIVCWTPSSGFSTCKSTHTPHHTTPPHTHAKQQLCWWRKLMLIWILFLRKKHLFMILVTEWMISYTSEKNWSWFQTCLQFPVCRVYYSH